MRSLRLANATRNQDPYATRFPVIGFAQAFEQALEVRHPFAQLADLLAKFLALGVDALAEVLALGAHLLAQTPKDVPIRNEDSDGGPTTVQAVASIRPIPPVSGGQ